MDPISFQNIFLFQKFQDLKSSCSEDGFDNTGYEEGGDTCSTAHVPHVYSVTHAPSSSSTSSDSDSSSTESKSQQNEMKLLSSLRSILVVVALSVHSLFEGMAIGLGKLSNIQRYNFFKILLLDF